jgi:hypothetical protein
METPMIVAFDVDNTLTKWPTTLVELATRLSGVRLILLTGNVGDPADREQANHFREARKQQIRELWPRHLSPPEIHVCIAPPGPGIANLKGEFCRDHKVAILLDDDPNYCKAVRRLSPATAVFQTIP